LQKSIAGRVFEIPGLQDRTFLLLEVFKLHFIT